VHILSESWSAPFDPPKYQKHNIMKLVEELEVKNTSHCYLSPYRPLVVVHTNPLPGSNCILLDANVGVQNS
jgi:hypothetical protein